MPIVRALLLSTLIAWPVLAAELPKTPPPPMRENQPPPLVKPPKPPRKAKGLFVQRRLARPPMGEGTPIVFSKTPELSLRPATARFEFEPGQSVSSAWPDADTAWLVRDLDGDGRITSGRELFGSFTRIGEGRAKNGFEALAALDADGNGFVSPREAALQLWFDRDGDRRVQSGELVEVGFDLPVSYSVDVKCDARGNCGKERARVTDGWLIDLHLRFSNEGERFR